MGVVSKLDLGTKKGNQQENRLNPIKSSTLVIILYKY